MTRDLAELAITTLWRILFATPKILPRHTDHDIAQRRCRHHEARDRMMKTMNGAEGSRRRHSETSSDAELEGPNAKIAPPSRSKQIGA